MTCTRLFDALALAVAQGIGVDGLGVGDAVQCPVIGQLGNGVQGSQQTVAALRRSTGWRRGQTGLHALRPSGMEPVALP